MSTNAFNPGPTSHTVRTAGGETLTVPDGWVLLPPGDAALTRRVKAADDHWVVEEKVGRKMFSRGIWAPAATIERIRADLEAERSTKGYTKTKDADARRREKVQAEYVEDFLVAVLSFLAFHPTHAGLADRIARAVTEHATPVGSGTVARTKRIPVEQRAESAVIAWMRHQTTGYDEMVIPRAKGKRREVRRMLARRSQELTHWPLDTHPNHHAVSSLVWQCYQRQGGWNLYFFEVMTDQQTVAFEPGLYLDIGPVRDVKKRALDAPKSQGPDTIWKAHETMHHRRGAECGVEFAEAYKLIEAKKGCPLLPVTFLKRKSTDSTPATISEPKRDEHGVLVHTVRSQYQAGETTIRVLVPEQKKPGVRLPVVYVLPVEARNESHYGDGLLEVQRHDLHNKFPALFVAPTFSHLPWYADHPSDPKIGQESYFLKVVIPFIESRYPVETEPHGRLLLGFSKSGWGAFSLLLRHPNVFGKAAAWDAPLMMDRPGRYGSGDIFSTTENFANYRLTDLLKRRAAQLGEDVRLIHMGYSNFRDEHEEFEAILNKLGVPHRYMDGPKREHRWESDWVPEAVGMLLQVR